MQFFGGTGDAGGTDDHAHAVGNVQAAERLAQIGAFLAFDAAGDASGARIIRHQHHIAPRQADERGQRRALGAALFFVDLHHEPRAFPDHIADRQFAVGIPGLAVKVLLGDLLQGQETVALGAEVDKGRLQAGLDAGDLANVDIGFLLQAGAIFDVQVVKALAVYEGHARLFGVRGIDEHFLHV